MQKLLIKGKRELTGKISISGSKNASLPILAASILAREVRLKNIPLVKDIFTMTSNTKPKLDSSLSINSSLSYYRRNKVNTYEYKTRKVKFKDFE